MSGSTVSDKVVNDYLASRGPILAIEIMADLVLRKMGKAGARLTQRQRRKVINWIAGECKSKLSLRVPGSKAIDVTPTPREFRRIKGRMRVLVRQQAELAVAVALKTMPPRLFRQLRKNWPAHAAKSAAVLASFEKRLLKLWKRPLAYLGMLIVLAEEMGAEIFADRSAGAGGKSEALFEALTRLHARACRIANEILLLLKNGYADGAMARWRSLHEVVVTMHFLDKKGDETAMRYLDHASIETCKSARFYQKHAVRLGHDPISETDMRQIESDRSELVKRYGKEFDSDYGWAAKAVNRSHVSFVDIEEAADLAHWRPHYRLASHNVHAQPKGILFQLGLPDADHLLTGPSDAGLTEPGQNTAISILQATAIVVQLIPMLDRLCTVQAMGIILDCCFRSFSKAETQ